MSDCLIVVSLLCVINFLLLWLKIIVAVAVAVTFKCTSINRSYNILNRALNSECLCRRAAHDLGSGQSRVKVSSCRLDKLERLDVTETCARLHVRRSFQTTMSLHTGLAVVLELRGHCGSLPSAAARICSAMRLIVVYVWCPVLGPVPVDVRRGQVSMFKYRRSMNFAHRKRMQLLFVTACMQVDGKSSPPCLNEDSAGRDVECSLACLECELPLCTWPRGRKMCLFIIVLVLLASLKAGHGGKLGGNEMQTVSHSSVVGAEGIRFETRHRLSHRSVAQADPWTSGFGVSHSVGDNNGSAQLNTWTQVASYHLQLFYGERMGGTLFQNLYPPALSVTPISSTSDVTSSLHLSLLVQLSSSPVDLTMPPLTMVYQPDVQAWLRVQGTQQPSQRGGQSLVASPDRKTALLFGGLTPTPSGSCTKSLSDTWAFDAMVAESGWYEVKATSTNKLTSAYSHSAAAIAHPPSSSVDYSMWVFGGIRSTFCTLSNELWELQIPEARWIQHNVTGGPTKRYKHQAVVTKDDTMIVFGGMSIDDQTSAPILYTDMWEFHPRTKSWTQLSTLVDDLLPTNSTFVQCIQELPIAYLSSEDVLLVFATVNSCQVQFSQRMVWLYKRSTDAWHPGPLSPSTPSTYSLQGHYWFALAVGRNSSVYHFAHSLRTGLDVILEFRYSEMNSPEGVWFDSDSPEQAAYQRVGHTSTYDPTQNLIYVLGGKATLLKNYFDDDFSSMDVSMFETNNRMWTQYRASNTPLTGRLGHTSVLIKSIIYVYGGYASAVGLPAMECLDTLQLAWLPTNATSLGMVDDYSIQSLHSAVRWQDKMIVIGGQMNKLSVSSTSIFSPGSREKCKGEWTNLQCTGDLPAKGVLGHTAVINGNDIYLFGGGYVDSSAGAYGYKLYSPAPLWRVSLEDNSDGTPLQCHWVRLYPPPKGGLVWPQSRFFHSATLMGSKMVISGGCFFAGKCAYVKGNVFSRLQHCCMNSTDPTRQILHIDVLPVLDTTLASHGDVGWLMLSMQELSEDVGVAAHTAIALDTHLLIQGGQHSVPDRAMLLPELASRVREDYLANVACPPGTYSTDFLVDFCNPCPIGQFSSLPASTACRQCPPKTQTYREGSVTVDSCQSCIPGTCHNGRCLVHPQNLTVSCECKFGYLYWDRCRLPFVYSFICIGVVFLAVVSACAVRKFRARTKKAKEYFRQCRIQRKEIAKLNNAWEIDFRDLDVRERIDKKDPGSGGKVHLAIYRDMEVAVKFIHSLQLSPNNKEFKREVELVRDARHPHMVMFLGAGGLDERRPFLVMEFMKHGSLKTVLHDRTKNIDRAQSLRFALDVAKGMRYLHRMNHMHRDLKPANLLVSEHGLVKVADFGTACLIKFARGIERAGDTEMLSSVDVDDGDAESSSLLGSNRTGQTELGSTSTRRTAFQGTCPWMAPEVLKDLRYGSACDIYRWVQWVWASSLLLPISAVYSTATNLLKKKKVKAENSEYLLPALPLFCAHRNHTMNSDHLCCTIMAGIFMLHLVLHVHHQYYKSHHIHELIIVRPAKV